MGHKMGLSTIMRGGQVDGVLGSERSCAADSWKSGKKEGKPMHCNCIGALYIEYRCVLSKMPSGSLSAGSTCQVGSIQILVIKATPVLVQDWHVCRGRAHVGASRSGLP